VRREEDVEALLLTDDVDPADLSFATRCAVTGSMADICIGGSTGDLGFRASVDDKV
jgi:hypothetical protein